MRFLFWGGSRRIPEKYRFCRLIDGGSLLLFLPSQANLYSYIETRIGLIWKTVELQINTQCKNVSQSILESILKGRPAYISSD